MKNKILKISIMPIVYLIIGAILFGNQDLMIVIFLSFASLIYNYLIDTNKNLVLNFIEINGIFILLFIIGFLLKDSDKSLVIKYISLVSLSFSIVYFLKKRMVTFN